MTKTCRDLVARRKRLCVVLVALLASLAMSPRALAQGAPDASAVAEAKKQFAEGSALYLAGRYAEALEALRTSYDLVPSPNSELVIARCLRELGRLVEAQATFASAEVEARRRVAEGSPKYEQTASSAASEGATVRAGLGTIRVRLEAVEAGAKLTVDGVATAIPADGDLVIWHPPGRVSVSVRGSSGLEQNQIATIRAGAEVTMGFTRPEPPLPSALAPQVSQQERAPPVDPVLQRERPGPSGSSGSPWAKPAALASGVVTVAGAGMFVGFWVAGHGLYQDLKSACGQMTGCGSPAQRSEAQTGKNDELIANVSLAVGAVAAAATIAFAAIAISDPPPPRTTRRTPWHLRVGVTSLGIVTEFE
jgi:hypothetical protein